MAWNGNLSNTKSKVAITESSKVITANIAKNTESTAENTLSNSTITESKEVITVNNATITESLTVNIVSNAAITVHTIIRPDQVVRRITHFVIGHSLRKLKHIK